MHILILVPIVLWFVIVFLCTAIDSKKQKRKFDLWEKETLSIFFEQTDPITAIQLYYSLV